MPTCPTFYHTKTSQPGVHLFVLIVLL